MNKIIVSLAIAFSALAVNAEETSTWNAGASGVWGVGYESNWDVYPDSTRYAHFSVPRSEPITVQVDGTVSAYGVVISTSRTADMFFTGTGTLNNYRNRLVPENTPCLTDWNINVVNFDTSSLHIYGTNVFHKALNCANTYTLSVKENSRVTLRDSARLTGQHMVVAAGSAFECLDSSVVSLTKDLKIAPGDSFRVADSSSLTARALTLPFSPENGVSDEWVMEGGTILPMNTSTDCKVPMPYTNATKTVSGTGTICTYRFDCAQASNLVFRLNGPNLYARDCYFSSSSPGAGTIWFEIGGGSTLGAYSGDAAFNNWGNRIVGAATIDTTDYDRTTPRTITMSKFDTCNGTLTVKGAGAFIINETVTLPNLNLTVCDSATLGQVSWGSMYALGDIVLQDNAKFEVPKYLGHKDTVDCVKSLTMSGNATLVVPRYVQASGDVALSGHASAVIRNSSNDSGAPLSCANLSLSDSASLVVTGMIAATSLTMSGDAHLSFMAGTTFAAGAAFGAGDWTMEITIPAGYEAGIRPVVTGAKFTGDFADHVKLVGDTAGWSAQTLNDDLILYKDSPASGLEWIGKSATSANWSDAANWNNGTLPTADDIVAFGGLSRPTPYNDLVNTVSGLVFRASAGPFTLSGSGDLTLTATSGGRGSATADNASIASHSAFDQTIASFVNFGADSCGVFTDGGGALKLTGGFNASGDWKYFVVSGDMRVGGTSSIGIFSFKNSSTATPSCLTVLPGGTFTIRNQYVRGLVESTSYIGRFVVEEGATMVVQNGDCVFWYGELENVINGTLIVQDGRLDNGRLVAGPREQYYVGKGAIYADSARSGRNAEVANHYINFGGTLKLYMNGNWYTATYRDHSEGVIQNPNYPTRFRMTDGTTLGAANDWTYGPMAGAYDTIAAPITPADRKSIMTGTVTVNTQNPTNDTAHTITFVDPLDASAATLVKTGAGTLRFNEPEGYKSQIRDLTVSAGGVSFAAVPTLSGTLTMASTSSKVAVDGVAQTMDWELLAVAPSIIGPNNATRWDSASKKNRFRIATEGSVMKLYGSCNSGLSVIVR